VETGIPQIQVEELKRRLTRGENLFVLDVREPHEYQIANLGGYLIPLGDLPKRVSELDSSREIVAHCRSGVRSAKAVGFLQQAGFRKCITWPAVSWRGRTVSIPRCPSTTRSSQFPVLGSQFSEEA